MAVVAPFQLGRRGVVQDVDLAVTVENLFVQPQRPAVVRDHGIETAQTLPCVADAVPGRGLTAAVPGLLHHGRCVLADSDRLPVLAEPAGRWRSHRDTQGVSVDAIQQVKGGDERHEPLIETGVVDVRLESLEKRRLFLWPAPPDSSRAVRGRRNRWSGTV
ncbi:hypothetical protein ACFCX0_29005 [Streptomyces sp. NPDC056352]|uniref:hypothetical protein n=1 Tax=Streptomyces sp. NPDC056352 TaxID=3345791 RepID=UPI0035DCA46B